MASLALSMRATILREGWRREPFPVDERGFERPWKKGDGYSLIESFLALPVSVARQYLRHALTRAGAVGGIVDWGGHPYRTAQEVVDLLTKCVRMLGGKADPVTYWPPAGKPKKGWHVETAHERKERSIRVREQLAAYRVRR